MRQDTLDYHRQYQKETRVKKARIEKYLQKYHDEIKKQMNDKKRGAFYEGQGGGLENIMKGKSLLNDSYFSPKCPIILNFTSNIIMKFKYLRI